MNSSEEQTHGVLQAFGGEAGIISLYGFENITIVAWHSTPTLAAAEFLTHVSMRRRAEFPHGISVVHLVQGTFELPDASTRDAFVRLLREGGGKLAVLCVLVRHGGFWASALRSLVTGLRVMSRDSFDLGLHTNIHEAVEYLLPRHLAKTGVAISGEQLESVLTTLSSSSPAT